MKLFGNENIPDRRVRISLDEYREVPGEYKRQYDDILDNDELRSSWINVVGSSSISKSEVETALSRYSRTIDRGHEPKEFMPASKANNHEFFDGKEDPVKPDSIVMEYEVNDADQFVRLFDSSESPGGVWMMRKSSFKGLNDRGGALEEFGLSLEFQDYDSVAKLELDGSESFRVRVSTAGELHDSKANTIRSGGGEQHWVRPETLSERLDWEPINQKIDEFIKGVNRNN